MRGSSAPRAEAVECRGGGGVVAAGAVEQGDDDEHPRCQTDIAAMAAAGWYRGLSV